MLTRPQPYETEDETHEAEAVTHEAEAKDPRGRGQGQVFSLEAEFEAKFMRRQRFEKPKNV